MRVLMLTHFSRGDVQPFAALAKLLEESGHEVTVGAPGTSDALLRPYTTNLIPFADRARDMAVAPDVRRLHGIGVPMQFIPSARRELDGMLDDFARALDSRPDVVLHHAGLPGHQIAEALGVPSIPVCMHPSYVPTNAFANPYFPFRAPRVCNPATYAWTGFYLRTLFPGMGRWRRRTLGLARRRDHRDSLVRPDGRPATVLQCFTRHVLPEPLDYPDNVHTTGHWLLPAADGWRPPEELTAFLDRGDPPVYVGFGSSGLTDPRRLGNLVAEALRRAGVRAVVVGGWGAIDPAVLGNDTFYLPEAPFDWLFPRMAAIVHHGGNGTIGYALAAGRPQVACPFISPDQWFYARQLHARGVAPLPQPHRDLTVEGLTGAISRAITDSRMAECADELGQLVRAEDGTAGAVKILESIS
ncbi:glycosyltransferase [Kribbella solani]|uniref:glycosyltransferase n=1 Tax=Kribbella solani TaxID=236067 RepID=UPI0029BF67E9|nr:glycosyltransferase [Kribbella solani]MDX3000831.1 glycosyltransferase [Kribbella solani]